ncbi:ATP synthase subunit g, mitochondrial-like [Lingula anatina]|uniref:ATP synthase subunit g, mitochondrial n=1 Tax=Lingula anatina TaxID=7574 RepID=A0A1S3JUW9_LINAN|nr:ATP synthase subunit g, mitochondrial [Lingula anatina]XP_013414112.1 ATP synthase subunit g, mitochondrial-like [Lingula anatina]|eukprot:XP_013414111.1 ATP synthase subunit g, mitochondrial [Lingula anatina]
MAFLQRWVLKGVNFGIKTVDFATPRLQTFWKYAKVELQPPRPSELSQVITGLQKGYARIDKGTWREVTVREAARNGLVGLEFLFIFFVGEQIGRRSIIGYNIPGRKLSHSPFDQPGHDWYDDDH